MNVAPLRVREMSDVHNEFGRLLVPKIADEANTVLILAGDIGVAAKASQTINPFLHDMCDRHRAVIYVCGNHEHYKGSLLRSHDKIAHSMKMDKQGYVKANAPKNLHILENSTVVIDHVAFIGATFWTNFHGNNPIAMWDAQSLMNDYKLIRTGTPLEKYKYKLRPNHLLHIHQRSAHYIFDEIPKQKAAGKKVVVVTHHAPSYESIALHFRNSRDHSLNGSYASEYAYPIIDAQPNFWVHGHTHTSFDYNIEGTRVICNPRGYEGEELNPGFNPNLVFEL